MKEGWLRNLGDSLDKMASLTSLSLDVNFYGEDKKRVLSTKPINCLLVPIKSLSALSVVFHSGSPGSFVGDCLIECTSLKKLSLTFNGQCADPDYGFDGLDGGLAITTSLDTLSLAIFVNHYDVAAFFKFLDLLNRGFSLNSSVNTLTVTVTVDECDVLFPSIFQEGLSENVSVTSLSLTINEYGEGESHIPQVLLYSGVFQYLAQNTSVITFILTLNSSKEVSDYWLPGLSDALKKNTSLTTLRLKVNNHCATGNSRLFDFSELVIESQTLALLELEVSFYGKDSGCQKLSIQ